VRRDEDAYTRTGERDPSRREEESLSSQHASIVSPAAKRLVRKAIVGSSK
jgi:hypothetical protein